MIRLALTYAALPEESVKIGAVVLLLLVLPRWVQNASDPAEMLVYSALGFAVCESLLYVIGFAETPQFQDHLIVFALVRGIFGGLLHVSLALVAAFSLAGHWRTSARWLWVLIAYATAVVFHATFDGSLLHLVFQRLQSTPETAATDDTGQTAVIFGLTFIILVSLAVLSVRRSRRLPV
jgi:RsiW-degrading membrane proteinase PrsW (M82 family)